MNVLEMNVYELHFSRIMLTLKAKTQSGPWTTMMTGVQHFTHPTRLQPRRWSDMMGTSPATQ
jgi:hypothetical protein